MFVITRAFIPKERVTMSTKYQDYLSSRIFLRNDYGSVKALLEAIEAAAAIPEDQEWRRRKAAFNEIGEKAPMRDGAYVLKYDEVPAFMEEELKAFTEHQFFFSNDILPTRHQYPAPYIDIVHLSTDGTIGISTFHVTENDTHHSSADWAEDHPVAETEKVAFFLYTGNQRLLDTAQVDGDTWREIEENGIADFYNSALENLSLQEAIEKRNSLQP